VYDIEELSLNGSPLRKDVCFDSKKERCLLFEQNEHAALFVLQFDVIVKFTDTVW
jgi:hypothetical protein